MSAELVIVGDEGWTSAEWEKAERRRAKARQRSRERRIQPEQREKVLAYFREYNKRPEVRAYKRQWMRDYRARLRAGDPIRVGFLHSLSCWGPHRHRRKGCIPIPVYSDRKDVA